MSNRRRVPSLVVSYVIILTLMLTIQSAAANTCAKCRKYCEKMKKKTKMTDLVVCGNDGKTYEDNCEFIHQQVSFLVACTRLYDPLCPSVGRSVTLSFFSTFYAILSHFKLFKVNLSQFTFSLLVFWSFSLLV